MHLSRLVSSPSPLNTKPSFFFTPPMALEAVVFPEDPFLYCTTATNYSTAYCNYPLSSISTAEQQDRIYANYFWVLDPNSSSPETTSSEAAHLHPHHHRCEQQQLYTLQAPAEVAAERSGATTEAASGRRKRRRVKNVKNKEEIENQRMTHIAVERNRRKQMNEYLSVLRSLMPPSYSQRGDQASIIGGAINFVKELEQLLQSMEAEKSSSGAATQHPFSDFFSFPQYSTRKSDHVAAGSAESPENHPWTAAAAADIEVTMVESHANLKILSRKRPKQLVKLVAGLQASRLSILHLNVTTTVDGFVLYSVSVKVEEGCQMSTVDEIAAAVNQLFRRIEEEARLAADQLR